jgi:maleamate amidohydrolase
MNSNENDVYETRSYGAQSIGFGEKPGIAVVDFQLGFTDPDHSLGGSALVQRAISNSTRLLNVARECGVPVANCYTGYSSARDKPYWKITAVLEGFIDGDHATQFDPRTFI